MARVQGEMDIRVNRSLPPSHTYINLSLQTADDLVDCQPLAMEQHGCTLAEKLDHLFHTVRPPRRRSEYSYEEAAETIREKGGPTISSTYIWQLRTGKRDNPTKSHLEALADFFGVPAAYFLDEKAAHRIGVELDLLAAMRDAGVREIALRSLGLSPQSLGVIREVIENTRRLEGLPEEDAPEPSRIRRGGRSTQAPKAGTE